MQDAESRTYWERKRDRTQRGRIFVANLALVVAIALTLIELAR